MNKPVHDPIGLGQKLFEASAIVSAVALLLANAIQLASHVPADGGWMVLPLLVIAGLCADLGSGLVHWACDTWGRESAPLIGRRLLRPFRVHHVNPRDFLRRDFISTNGDVAALISVLLLCALVLGGLGPGGYWTAVFLTGFCAVGLPTNQVHQWAHMPHPPRWVAWLQRRRIILGRRAHAEHHRAPHTRNYCIATGWMNPLCERLNLFRRLEGLVTRLTGLEPRTDEVRFQRGDLPSSVPSSVSSSVPSSVSSSGVVSPASRDDASEGRRSAMISVFFGALALGGVCCLRWPAWFTAESIRSVWPVEALRVLLQVCLTIGLGFGVYGTVRGRHRRVAALGLLLAAVATLLGGAFAPVGATSGSGLALDWFLVNLLISVAIFVPLERLTRSAQPVLRSGFATDLAHFATNHLLVEVLTIASLWPVAFVLGQMAFPEVHSAVGALPLAGQLMLLLVFTDLCGYLAHRLSHSVGFLWRFHAVHHSSETLDWLAASRLHIVDVVFARAVGFIPVFLLGFDTRVTGLFVALLSLHAVFNHTTVRWHFGSLARWVVTPRVHHWHHARTREAIDTNFGVQLTLWDRLFGTWRVPERWPEALGLTDERAPKAFWGLLWWPFRSRRSGSETPGQLVEVE